MFWNSFCIFEIILQLDFFTAAGCLWRTFPPPVEKFNRFLYCPSKTLHFAHQNVLKQTLVLLCKKICTVPQKNCDANN